MVEIGCGVGRLTRVIAPEVLWVNAFDISDKMLDLARHHALPNVTLRLTQGDTLRPLPDASADMVLAYCVLHHLPSEQAFRRYVDEMFRVVRPGGTVAFTLTPRDWRVYFEPLLRIRRWLKEMTSVSGPSGLYRREWIGIRPRKQTIMRLLPLKDRTATQYGENWLFFAHRNSLREETAVSNKDK